MGLGLLLRGAALREIVKLAPHVVDAARQMMAGTRGEPSRETPLAVRIEQLEARMREQGRVTAQLAEQLQALTIEVAAAERRNRVAIALSTAAMLVSLATLVILLL